MGARLGQHFLRDERIARRILEAAELQPGQRVLEIGPGGGVLTRPLCEAVGPDGHVVAIEADPLYAAERAGHGSDNLSVIEADALHVDLAELGPFDRIVANLPYQISGPVTARLLDLLREQGWGLAVLMFQQEFAERLLAGPGSKKYGRLSVYAARVCRVEKVRDVPPGAFSPPPKVRSTVLRLVPHEVAPFDVRDETMWRNVVDGAFAQRRKQLKNSLPAALGRPTDQVVAVLAEMATLRPEQVSPAQFAGLAARLAEA